jgi:beta-RFAP synthase
MRVDSPSSSELCLTQDDLQRSVRVITTARLHMGFIDLHGGLGRQFGSIGLSLDHPATCLDAFPQAEFTASGPQQQRVLDCARQFAAGTGLPGGAHIAVVEAIPDHAGLGSGTQLGLAVGVALARLYHLDLSIREIAVLSGRGRRSGIGIGAFEQGGLLVDGGRGVDTVVPPIVARMDFPDDWRVLLIFDPAAQGVHGQAEIKAFGELPEFPSAQAAHIARLILMQALPAVAEHDLQVFGEAISALQRIVGEHFALAQGGGLYISPRVADAMDWLRKQGVACTGQSSWGPTGFAVVESDAEASMLTAGLRNQRPDLHIEICRARNQGSLVTENGHL